MQPSCRSAALLVTALVLSLVAACGGSDEPAPPAADTGRTAPAKEKKKSPPKWRKDFTKAEVAAYREAKKRWADYTRRSEPIWSRGTATPEARTLFEDFFFQPDVMFQLLESYEKKSVTVRGVPLVLSSRPTKVLLDKDPVTVVLRQCIDARPVQMTAAGVSLNDPDQTPVQRRITLSRVDGGPYQVIAYKGPETGDKIPCG